MTVIRPNSVSGINSITAQANEIKIFKSDGTQGGLVIGGANLNATSGISTVAALTVTGNVSVGGTLTYQDVTNIDSVGIVTSRNIIFSGSTGTPGQFVLRRDSDGANIGQFRSDAGTNDISIGNGGSGSLILKTGANTERLRITPGGLVGIGTDNPSVNLHVKGSASNGQIYLGGTGAHSQIYADNDGVLILNADQGNSAANSYLGFNVDNSERLRIDSGGRIAQGGRTPTNHGSPNLLLWGADPTLHISATGSTANTSFAGIKFAVAGGSTGDYSKAGIFVQRQDSYNDLDMIFAFRSSNDATGVSVSDEKIRINSDGHVLPGANNTYDLGSTAKGWRNVYMNDLNLSNMNGDTNDVDGTQGSWTIQEGKDDLYIINRLNGKKFKIKMEEIS